MPDKEANKKRAGSQPRPSVPKGSSKSVGQPQTPGDSQSVQGSKASPPPASVTR